MTKKQSRTHSFRSIVEIVFLTLFVFLFLQGSIQLWLGVFAFGAFVSVFFGRIYCGWICPMNTLFRPITKLRIKFGIRPFKSPRFMTYPAVRYVFLFLFLASMLAAKRLGKELPLPAIITGLSVIVVLFFEEALWHNSICPYGTIFNFTSRFARKSMAIDENKCISCGKCQKVCPSHAIATLDTTKRFIRKIDCLTCQACAEACLVKAIQYRSPFPK